VPGSDQSFGTRGDERNTILVGLDFLGNPDLHRLFRSEVEKAER
jgi:hypothetical protein